jgi:glycerophosphoryl diester phosphodiesterase
MRKITYLLAGMALMSSCKSQKDQSSAAQAIFPVFSVEAHRGGRGLVPENTIIAMKHAVDLGVTTLEMDTHVTSDHEVVVSHDDYLSSQFILKPSGEKISKKEEKSLIIYKMNYADLRKYDVGSKFYDKFPEQKKINTYIPRLSELIDSVQTYIKEKHKKQPFYNIETKCDVKGDGIYNPEPEQFVKLLMDVVMKKNIAPYTVIQSFDKRTIQLIHKQYPAVRTSYLINNKKSFEENIAELGYKPFIYSPEHKLVTAELVAKCHALQIKIIPWTANTKADIQRLKSLKVDGIITDYPNLLVD